MRVDLRKTSTSFDLIIVCLVSCCFCIGSILATHHVTDSVVTNKFEQIEVNLVSLLKSQAEKYEKELETEVDSKDYVGTIFQKADAEHWKDWFKDQAQNVVRHRRSADEDQKCQKQEHEKFMKPILADKTQFEHKHVFSDSDNMGNIALIWAGKDTGVILAVPTYESFTEAHSDLWRSTDNGRTFNVHNQEIGDSVVRDTHGLQKHPKEWSRVFVLIWRKNHTLDQTTSTMYVSKDTGATFVKANIPCNIEIKGVGAISWSPTDAAKGFIICSGGTLVLTTNYGYKWTVIGKEKQRAVWSGDTATKGLLFATQLTQKRVQGNLVIPMYSVQKTRTTINSEWSTVFENVFSFGATGAFVFATVPIDKDDTVSSRRRLLVSKDGGEHFDAAQLPTLTPDKFVSVMGQDDGQLYLHVQYEPAVGSGALYVSDESGIIYSLSMDHHFYPSGRNYADFYKVKSMDSVLITSKSKAIGPTSALIQSAISFNRGISWSPIQKPEGSSCTGSSKECALHLHGKFDSQRTRIPPPLSTDTARGIILAHGSVSDALQRITNVYITNDGGYTWTKALDGPHRYLIADSGGLLVAVSLQERPVRQVKFSVDFGHCWHTYDVSQHNITMTGILSQPGGNRMEVALWGYDEIQRWLSVTLDFNKIIPQCKKEDYENIEADGGKCVLGKKTTITRVKPNSWCKHGETTPESNSASCRCEKTGDYLCSFGYKRSVSGDCEELNALEGRELEVCKQNFLLKIDTSGYRKIPGDKCFSGWKPNHSEQLKNLTTKCSTLDKTLETVDGLTGKEISDAEKETPSPPTSHHKRVGLTVFLVLLALAGVAVACFFGVRYVRRRRQLHGGMLGYSFLSQGSDSAQLLHPDDEIFAPTIQPATYGGAESDVDMLP